MKQFYSNGKLLLTGEYLVLDGAKALAIPTSYGQSMTVAKTADRLLHWKSIDHQGNTWFEGVYDHTKGSFHQKNKVSDTLAKLIREAQGLNPDFLMEDHGYEVVTTLNFPNDWGLGSSSTLINNLAQWAQVDAYALLWNAFTGSGYDIACAQHDSPLVYWLEDGKPNVKTIALDLPFKSALYFVHLNQKQNSREAIAHYRSLEKEHLLDAIEQIDVISQNLLIGNDLPDFEILLDNHEAVMSNLLGLQMVKERLFPDFPGSIKSLGAWGGDFVLATGESTPNYFKEKGFTTIIPFHEMILQ